MAKATAHQSGNLTEQLMPPMSEELEERVNALETKFFKPPGYPALQAHSRIKTRFPTVRIADKEWLWIIVVSTVIGLAIYVGIVGVFYHIAAGTMQQSRAQFADPWPVDLSPTQAAALTLDNLGVSQDVSDKLETAIAASRGNDAGPDRNRPQVLSLATSLLVANRPGSCSDCGEDCLNAIKPVLVRMLLGWPMAETERAQDVKFLQDTFGDPKPSGSPPTPEQKLAACRQVQARSNLSAWQPSFAMIHGRQEPWPAPMVAQLAMGASHCSVSESDQARRDLCQLVSRLFQTLIDDADVKLARSSLVDFFYGWERAAVFILVVVMVLALWRLRRARRRLELEAEWVKERLESRELAIGLDPMEPSRSIDTTLAALALKSAFNRAFKPTLSEGAQEPVAEIVAATAEAVQQADLEYLKTFVDRNQTEFEASRELMNGIITIFPVIGFSATLLGLVHALAGANQIATSNGDMRSASILGITSLLSSCFATTFLALVSMAIFAVINLLAGSREQQIIAVLSGRLISKFRPGRIALTSTQLG
jgi:hypothetical protein